MELSQEGPGLARGAEEGESDILGNLDAGVALGVGGELLKATGA